MTAVAQILPGSAVAALRDARVVLDKPGALPTASWARSVAVLGRQALERALNELWAQCEPSMSTVRARKAQFICLRQYVDPELAGRAWFAWTSLSNACHHHAYEMPPSEAELHGWLAVIDELLNAEAKEMGR